MDGRRYSEISQGKGEAGPVPERVAEAFHLEAAATDGGGCMKGDRSHVGSIAWKLSCLWG